MSNKYLIIFHKDDNDGLFSMAIIYNYLVCEKNVNKEDIDLYGANYNMLDNLDIQKDIIDKYSHLIITDVSFSADMNKMKTLVNIYNDRLMWFDHHAPLIVKAEELHINNVKGLRSVEHSALYNAFVYLYNFIGKVPDIFKVLSAWDSFTYDKEKLNMDYCRYVNCGVNNKFNLDDVSIIKYVNDIIYHYTEDDIKNSIDKLREIGKIECDIIDRQNSNLIKDYADFSWVVDGNRTACALFYQAPTNTQVFVSCKDKVQNGIVFKHLADGNWVMSLYNTNNQKDFHCGTYLKEHYNGGGHEGAAGSTITQEKFIEILKVKSI